MRPVLAYHLLTHHCSSSCSIHESSFMACSGNFPKDSWFLSLPRYDWSWLQESILTTRLILRFASFWLRYCVFDLLETLTQSGTYHRPFILWSVGTIFFGCLLYHWPRPWLQFPPFVSNRNLDLPWLHYRFLDSPLMAPSCLIFSVVFTPLTLS